MHTVYYLIIFLFGLAIGSFLNVVIFRLAHGKGIGGRSMCPTCTRTLRWFELIPVLSYMIQLGRCRGCKTHISLQYPIVELVVSISFVVISFYIFPDWLLITNYWLLIIGCIILFVIDLRYGILPDVITIPLLAVSGVTFVLTHPQLFTSDSHLLIQWLSAIAIGGGFFWVQRLASKGRWVGNGDVRLGAIMGALLGLSKLILAFYIAYISGAIVALILLLMKNVTRKTAIPFGPFLIIATLMAFIWGDAIIHWYWGLLM